jgi:SpoVK/Ycf46/Vps4 family AAA+-type ATPase
LPTLVIDPTMRQAVPRKVQGKAMANAEQIKALVTSHSEGDDPRFYAVALQIAAREARAGRTRVAEEIREAVEEAKKRAGAGRARAQILSISQPRGELAGLLTAEQAKARLSDMVLTAAVRERLREHGLSAMRKLLLIGPPGTGKTFTASVLAGELGLTLFTIQLHALITKFMGETAAKLHLVFDTISKSRAVYFFDEFDALGGERASAHDVGEMRRVLGSLLGFIERDASESLIVAATNHPRLLDRALFRRFDSVIEYDLPALDVTEQLMRNRLATLDTQGMEWAVVVEASKGLSHADVARACEDAAKQAVLGRSTSVATGMLVGALNDRRGAAG